MINITTKTIDSIFRKNDIRGKVPSELNYDTAKRLGQAFALFVSQNLSLKLQDLWVSIGYDARLHSPMLAEGLISGINEMGANVIDLKRCSTPLVYFSNFFELNDYPTPHGSIMITGSHNPPEFNGLKMCLSSDCLTSSQILDLKELFYNTKANVNKESGKILNYDLNSKYHKYLFSHFKNISKLNKPLKIVIDSGNGCAGEIVPALLRNMGCEIIELFSNPDGTFPNHHPDPTMPENLEQLIKTVIEIKADFGVAYDGDVDRIGLIDDQGSIIPGDMLMLLFALDIIEENKYKTPVFISEVKCSQLLYDTLNSHDANAIMWKTGHSFIKDKMKKENALLAGEMSGHLFFADRYYGFDDATYATCRLLEFIAKKRTIDSNFTLSSYFSSFPKLYNTPEIRKACSDEKKFEIIDKIKEKLLSDKQNKIQIKEIITIDGIRIIFEDGFGLIRASNTEPVLVLRFESINEIHLKKYQNFVEELLMKAEEML